MTRLAIAFICGGLLLASCGLGQDFEIKHDKEADATRITIPTPRGMVDWRTVARAIARAERLDERAVAEVLPSETLDLNRARARWVIRGLSIALGSGVRLRIQRDGDRIEALVIDIDRDQIRDSWSRLKGVARQVVFHWDDREDSPYGLLLDEDWQRRDASRPLVVIIHGYSSKPEEFLALRSELREAGFTCAAFSYPNDHAVAASGRQLAAALREFQRQHPQRRLRLLAHSMGGLVARVAIEDPTAASVPNADQLLMVATPNQGTNLARIPLSLDAWEHLVQQPDELENAFFDSVRDGLNEARQDLQPGSTFLRRLNARPRNPRVKYSLLLGNDGPATRQQLNKVRRELREAQQEHAVLRALGPRLDAFLQDLDELVEGKGDGVVAVERGRLAGVEDTEVLPFGHTAITSDLSDEPSQRLLKEVIDRLK
jgi:pimeloyl-ACP methyl ester carboxylesterase